MFFSVFHQHTRADGRDFKSAHRMSITICSSHQAQGDFRAADSLSRGLRVCIPAIMPPRLRKSRPISPIERNIESGAGQRLNIWNTILVGGADENYIGSESLFLGVRYRWFGKVRLWRISKWQI